MDKNINTWNSSLTEASAGAALNVLLSDSVLLNRGDMLVDPEHPPQISSEVNALICWFDAELGQIKKNYWLCHTTRRVICKIRDFNYKIDIQNLKRVDEATSIQANDLCAVTLKLEEPIFWDHYEGNRTLGSFILVDPNTSRTVAAGLIGEVLL